MIRPADPYFLRVFTDKDGRYGDVASVVIDEERQISDVDRQNIARELNTGETIFINDLGDANISVMHPQGEISFADVGVLATAWLITGLLGEPIDVIRARDGEISTWREDDLTWVRASLSTMPPWNFQQLGAAIDVERLKAEDMASVEHTMVWAWIDRAKGLIRARTFASDWDIPEAQGNGSGSLLLAAKLGLAIEIKHGTGSVIFARPDTDNSADIGGRIAKDNLKSE